MEFYFATGTNLQRTYLSGGTYPIPVSGKTMWTIDTKKLYVGDGSTAGGILVGPLTDYSGMTNTAHTHSEYVAPYTSVVFDRITATSLTTTGSSIRTTTITATTISATSVQAKGIVISGDGGSSKLTFKGTGSDVDITVVHANPSTIYMSNISSPSITGSASMYSPVMSGTAISATTFWCGSTNINTLMGGVGATDHGALTGLYDDDHPQYRGTGSTSSLSGAAISATTFFSGANNLGNVFRSTGSTIPASQITSGQFAGSAVDFIFPRYVYANTAVLSGDNIYINDGNKNEAGGIYVPAAPNTAGNFYYVTATSTWQTSNPIKVLNTITGSSISATTFRSGSTNLSAMFAGVSHSHSPSNITDGTFTGDTVFNGEIDFGKGITGKSAYFINNITGSTIICKTHMSGGSMFSILRSGTTDVILRMGTVGAEIHTLTLDQSAGGGLSHFILSTGLTLEGPFSSSTYCGITSSMVNGGASNPEYFGSASKTRFGFNGHTFIDNNYEDTGLTNTALYFRITGNTKAAFELHKDTREFKFFSPVDISNWNFATGNVTVAGSFFSSIVSATTYSGISVTKSITVPDPRANENIAMFYLDTNANFIKVIGAVSGSSSQSVAWTLVSAATRTGSTGTITGATTTSQDGVVYTIQDRYVPANTWIILKTSSTGATTNELHLTVKYTEV